MKVAMRISSIPLDSFKMHINGYVVYVSFGDLPFHGVCGCCGDISSEQGEKNEDFYNLRRTYDATLYHEIDLLSGEGPFTKDSKPFKKIERKIAKAFSKQGDGLCEKCFWETVDRLGEII